MAAWQWHKVRKMRDDLALAVADHTGLLPHERDELNYLVRNVVDHRGAFWKSADEIAADRGAPRSTTQYRLAALRRTRFLNQVRRGGGCHRTSIHVVMLKPVLDRHDKRAVDWQALLDELRAEWREWVADVFRDHFRRGDLDCMRWAPSRLQPRELSP